MAFQIGLALFDYIAPAQMVAICCMETTRTLLPTVEPFDTAVTFPRKVRRERGNDPPPSAFSVGNACAAGILLREGAYLRTSNQPKNFRHWREPCSSH